MVFMRLRGQMWRQIGFFWQRLRALVLAVAILLASAVVPVHPVSALTAGPNPPATAANNTGVGTIAWTNPTNALTSNSTYASNTITAAATGNYLFVTGFGFSLPSTATINGITVEVQKYATTATKNTITDNSVKILQSGAVAGTEKATTATWPSTNSFVTYGSSSDTWGVTTAWTPTLINATNFGVAISAKNVKSGSGSSTLTANVDFVRITLDYTATSSLSQSAYRFYQNADNGNAWCNATTGVTCDSTWQYREQITINSSSIATNLTNFPILVKLDATRINYAHTQTGGADIRFVDPSDNTTVLPDEVESWNSSGTSYIWVKVPLLAASSSGGYIWMYYGKSGASDGQQKTSVWDSNFVGVWHMNGTSGTENDSTSYATNGTVSGSPTRGASGEIGTGYGFSGVAGTDVSMGDPADGHLDFSTNSFTYGGWFDITANTGNYQVPFWKGGSSNTTAGYDIETPLNASTVQGNIADGTTKASGTSVSSTIGQWMFIVIVIDRSANLLHTYINGSESLPTVSTSAVNNISTANNLYFGDEGGTYPLSGNLDEVRLSNTARSADWVKAEYLADTDALNSFGSEQSYAAYVAGSSESPLSGVAQDTAATVVGTTTPFRLRMLEQVSYADLTAASATLKLQYALRSGTCDTAYSGETYNDVTTATNGIRYYDNPTMPSGMLAPAISSDVAHGAETTVRETYQESNNFTNPNPIPTGQDGLWDFALTATGAATGDHYCFRIVKSDNTLLGTPLQVPEIIVQADTAPNASASLAQAKTDNTSISTGAWTNANSVKFNAQLSDPDSSDSLQLCVEAEPLATSFTNTETACGTGVAYSGTAVSASVTLSSLSNATQYHWQARTKDAAGLYSAWTSYGGNAESAADFGIDTSLPTTGTVYDGTTAGVDASFNDGSLTSLSANWSGFSDSGGSGLARYDYAIGTTAGGTDVVTWTSNGTTASVTVSGLTLQTTKTYYFSVRAVDGAGNVSSAVLSDGQLVSPTLSFGVTPSATTFNHLNGSNSYTDSQTTTLTTSTNAYGGYVVKAFATGVLAFGGRTIPDFSAGSYASPNSWQSGDTGYGYTSSDTSVQGVNKFQAATCPGGRAPVAPGCFAPFAHSGPGDIIADHTANVSGSPVSNEQFTITSRVTTSATQAAGLYQTTVVYTVVPLY